MSTKPLDRLLKDVPADNQPALVRRAYLRAIVDQVNRNTIALAPPRSLQPAAAQTAIDNEIIEDTQEGADEDSGIGVISDIWAEVGKVTETVRVTNPEDEEQYVDVLRRTQSIFRSNVTGRYEMFIFDNSDLET